MIKSIDGIGQKKKFFWDQIKNDHRYWLAANMMGEAFLGFGAFNTKKITGADTIDFIKNRQLVAEGALVDEGFMEEVLGKPKSVGLSRVQSRRHRQSLVGSSKGVYLRYVQKNILPTIDYRLPTTAADSVRCYSY